MPFGSRDGPLLAGCRPDGGPLKPKAIVRKEGNVASSSVRAFTEPDEYAAAIRQGTHNLTITERGNFKAKLWRIDLPNLWMQRFSEKLARTSHVDGWGGRAVIAFRNKSGPSVARNG